MSELSWTTAFTVMPRKLGPGTLKLAQKRHEHWTNINNYCELLEAPWYETAKTPLKVHALLLQKTHWETDWKTQDGNSIFVSTNELVETNYRSSAVDIQLCLMADYLPTFFGFKRQKRLTVPQLSLGVHVALLLCGALPRRDVKLRFARTESDAEEQGWLWGLTDPDTGFCLWRCWTVLTCLEMSWDILRCPKALLDCEGFTCSKKCGTL